MAFRLSPRSISIPRSAARATLALALAMGLLLGAPLGSGCVAEAEGPDRLLLSITSDAPTGDVALNGLRLLWTDGDTLWPTDRLGANAIVAIADSADSPVNRPFIVGVGAGSGAAGPGALTFGDNAGEVTLQITGWSGPSVQTVWEGTVDLNAITIQPIHMTIVPSGCDGDQDGFLDCAMAGCCDVTGFFADCEPGDGGGGANPWFRGVETCDGLDDDCDGLVDEDLVNLVPEGAQCLNSGVCGGAGVASRSCLGATFECAYVASEFQADNEFGLCDGLDNDCDGATDEDFDGLDIGACGLGICAGGTMRCTADALGTECSTAGRSLGVELCDGLDNDCDGETDEVEDLEPDLTICKSAGVCAAPGAVEATCVAGAWVCAYLAENYQAADEVGLCDSLDNDCDGATDEDYATGALCDGPDGDLCPNGELVCDGLAAVACGPESIEDIAEQCNFVDDDCDGATDEDFETLGKTCDGSDSDSCAYGTWTCVADGGAVECVNETTSDLAEVCDGFDNDCDGATDEAFPTLKDACDGDDSDFCANGFVVCTDDKLGTMCSTESKTDIVESCNGADDDCDGDTDEDFTDLGAPCDGDDSDLCPLGATVCSPDGVGTICGTESKTDLVERCNGADDDCDGDTDEAFPELGAVCDGADADSCINGTRVCAGDELSAVCEESLSFEETCNHIDDDCDGDTDEGFGLGDVCDGPGDDFCAYGTVICDGEGGALCYEFNGNVPESCEPGEGGVAMDEDCDGMTDEGCP